MVHAVSLWQQRLQLLRGGASRARERFQFGIANGKTDAVRTPRKKPDEGLRVCVESTSPQTKRTSATANTSRLLLDVVFTQRPLSCRHHSSAQVAALRGPPCR
jgi:hypothetical protein